jgi:hypothetical protein
LEHFGTGLGRGREECLVAKPLPTGVPAGRGVTEYAAKDHVIFSLAQIGTILCGTTCSRQFLHWNNSRLKESYCINGI